MASNVVQDTGSKTVDESLLLTCQGIYINVDRDKESLEALLGALQNGAFPNLNILKLEASSAKEFVDLPCIRKCDYVMIKCPGIDALLPKISQTVRVLALTGCGLTNDSIKLLQPSIANVQEL